MSKIEKLKIDSWLKVEYRGRKLNVDGEKLASHLEKKLYMADIKTLRR